MVLQQNGSLRNENVIATFLKERLKKDLSSLTTLSKQPVGKQANKQTNVTHSKYSAQINHLIVYGQVHTF